MEKLLAAHIDVSRNSVLKPEQIKKFIDIIVKMGYNALVIYHEDLFEMPEYPKFGYMRGRYSREELKELVAYGEERGVTLIPAMQSLAHIEHIFRWRDFNDIHDMGNTLLADESKTYEFIEAMVRTLREIYKTDYMSVGCDESWVLGRGRHLDRFGYEPAREIFVRHMEKVVEIVKKYGFIPRLSSDMFFDYAGGKWGVVSDPELITPEIAAMFPENCVFGYWNYFPTEKDVDNTFIAAKRFGAPVGYATSVDSWSGFTPHNYCAYKWIKTGVTAARRQGIDWVTVTFWGDDGGECSVFSCLPAFFYAAQLYHGIDDMAEIEKTFSIFSALKCRILPSWTIPSATTASFLTSTPQSRLSITTPLWVSTTTLFSTILPILTRDIRATPKSFPSLPDIPNTAISSARQRL